MAYEKKQYTKKSCGNEKTTVNREPKTMEHW